MTEKQVGKRFLACLFLSTVSWPYIQHGTYSDLNFFFFLVILSESASAQAYQENVSFPNTHQATGSPLPGPNDPVPSRPSRPAAPGSGAEGRARPSQCGSDPQQGPDPALSCSDSVPCSCWGLSPARTVGCDSVVAGPLSRDPGPAPAQP